MSGIEREFVFLVVGVEGSYVVGRVGDIYRIICIIYRYCLLAFSFLVYVIGVFSVFVRSEVRLGLILGGIFINYSWFRVFLGELFSLVMF